MGIITFCFLFSELGFGMFTFTPHSPASTLDGSYNLFASLYISFTNLIIFPNTFRLRLQYTTSLDTLLYAFSRSINAQYIFLVPPNSLSCCCLVINIASVAPLPFMNPNCISSISTLLSTTLSVFNPVLYTSADSHILVYHLSA